MHKFNVDIRVMPRALTPYVIQMVSQYMLNRISQIHTEHGLLPTGQTEVHIVEHADCTRLMFRQVADCVASTYPDGDAWQVVPMVILGRTEINGMIQMNTAPATIALTVQDQNRIYDCLGFGGHPRTVMTKNDEAFFNAWRTHIIPSLDADARAAFDAWRGCTEDRLMGRLQYIDEAPFLAPSIGLRMSGDRIVSMDVIAPHRSVMNLGPRSRQQFSNDGQVATRGKKGRTKMFAGKSGGVWPKPGGTRGY